MMSQAVESKRGKQGKGKTARLRETALSTGLIAMAWLSHNSTKDICKELCLDNTLAIDNVAVFLLRLL